MTTLVNTRDQILLTSDKSACRVKWILERRVFPYVIRLLDSGECANCLMPERKVSNTSVLLEQRAQMSGT
jgi:hypothetical protein